MKKAIYKSKIIARNLNNTLEFLKKGGELTIFSPYLLKQNVFFNKNGDALKFADEVDPLSDNFVQTGDFFKEGYEQGWMTEGAPRTDSMCSMSKKTDFISRSQYMRKEIIKIDRVNHKVETNDEPLSFENKLSPNVFLCSYDILAASLKKAKLAYAITEEGVLALIKRDTLAVA